MADRERILTARQKLAPRDETLYTLTQTATRQARVAATLSQWTEVRRHLDAGFAREAQWRASSGSQLDLLSVALWAVVQLHGACALRSACATRPRAVSRDPR